MGRGIQCVRWGILLITVFAVHTVVPALTPIVQYWHLLASARDEGAEANHRMPLEDGGRGTSPQGH